MRFHSRFYVTHDQDRRFRQFRVVEAEAVANRSSRLSLRYTTVSRHWTWKRAQKAAHNLNRQEGTTA